MRLGLKPPVDSQMSTADYAVRAEALGYESIWQGELWGKNVFIELAEAAHRTRNIRLGTAIVNVFSRTPAVIAMGANSLNQHSNGRAVIGLGVSSSKVINDLHSLEYDRPVRRTHETAELLQDFLTADGKVTYNGEIFNVSDFSSLDTNVPIYNAALGPANRRATGRTCDGWLPNNIPFSYLNSAFETVANAACDSRRDPDDIEVAPWIHVAVDDENPDKARDLIRDTIAYYVGSGKGYENAVGMAFPERTERIADAWRSGATDEARASVTDEMVSELGCAGRSDYVLEQLQRVVDETPTDVPIIDIPQGAEADLINRTIKAVAPS